MSDPSLDLQRALVAALTAHAGLTALIGSRVYDQPPARPTFPYVTLGEDQILPDRADCYDGSDVTLTIHAWSRAAGFPEAKRIVAAIRDALGGGLALGSAHRLVELAVSSARFMRDPDGETSHAVITYSALTEPA